MLRLEKLLTCHKRSATGFIGVILRSYHPINKTYWTIESRRPTLTAYRGPLRAVGGADVPQIPNCSFAKSNSQVEQILSSSCSSCPRTPVPNPLHRNHCEGGRPNCASHCRLSLPTPLPL